MKKILLLTCVTLSALLTFAQETKKVAILEVVDKEEKVSYANKLILRSSLAKAMTETPGYEAYDRTDLDAILGEQNFQRTGLVSNDQIKQLGEMTGAQYVLVAEAVVVDAQNMFITAKLLDVETARTEITNNQMMGVSAKEIKRGCQLLASNLVKPGHAASATQPIAVTNNSLASITKVSNNEYRMNGTVMDRKAYENFIYQNCPEAWKKHLQAKQMIAAGWTFFSVGVPLIGTFALIQKGDNLMSESGRDYDSPDYIKGRNLHISGIVCGSIGAGFVGLGSALLAGGYSSKHNTYKVYNKKCAPYASTPITFNLTAGYNGVGMVMHF